MDVYEEEKYVDIEFAVFANVYHACYTKQEHDIHGSVDAVVSSFIDSIRTNQSNTAYILSVKKQNNYLYISSAKKRQDKLWRRKQNQ